MTEEMKDTMGSAAPEPAAATAPLGPNQRWTIIRKREVALRLLRGEPMDALSRELGVEIYRLEEWKNKALAGIDASLREREGDPLERDLQSARSKIGELMMDNELLREKIRRPGPLAKGRLKTGAQQSPPLPLRSTESSACVRSGSSRVRASMLGGSTTRALVRLVPQPTNEVRRPG